MNAHLMNEKSQTVKVWLVFLCPVIRTEAHRERLVQEWAALKER